MILMCLPCPPLPIIANSPIEGESNTVLGCVTNSHDLLAHLLNVRAACAQAGVDEERKVAQDLALQRLYNAFDELEVCHGLVPCPETCYTIFCGFMRYFPFCVVCPMYASPVVFF